MKLGDHVTHGEDRGTVIGLSTQADGRRFVQVEWENGDFYNWVPHDTLELESGKTPLPRLRDAERGRSS